MPYRVPCPPQPDAPELEHPYAAVLRRQRRRARVVAALIAVVAVAGLVKVVRSKPAPHRHGDSEAVRIDQARRAIAGARARAASEQASFEAGVRDALGRGLVARPDLGPCPFTLPTAGAPGLARRRAFPLLVIERAAIAEPLPSQAVAEVLADVGRAEAHLGSGRFEEAALYARALDRPERFDFDVILVAKAEKKPHARSGHEYEPGEIAGRAYVYDFATRRVVCAGEVHAQSSKTIGYAFSERVDAPARLGPVASMGDAIDEDIRRQTERAIAASVAWRAGPPLGDDAPE